MFQRSGSDRTGRCIGGIFPVGRGDPWASLQLFRQELRDTINRISTGFGVRPNGRRVSVWRKLHIRSHC
jgi:hypothetical protein